MDLPKIGNARNEMLGVSTVQEVVFRKRGEGGLGFAFRSQPEVDKGIDGHLEVVDHDTDKLTGKLVGVQIKAGPAYFKSRIPEGGPEGWIVYIDKSTVNYWRSYSVPVLLTIVDTEKSVVYWAMGSEGAFEETEESFKIPVPAAQRLDRDAADFIAALAKKAPELLARLRIELSQAVSSDLDRYRTAWREGKREDARAWLGGLVHAAPARLAIIDASVAAAVLRFAASTAVEETADLDGARGWIDEAKRLDPGGNDVRMRAALLCRQNDAEGALTLLSAAPDPSAQVRRALILASLGRCEAAKTVLDSIDWAGPTVTAVDQADAWQVRARLRLADGDLSGAVAAAARAEEYAPTHVEVRLLRAVLTYFEGLVTEEVPDDVPPWPQPVPDVFVRGDPDAVGRFTTAAQAFDQLLQLDWAPVRRRQIETWRLAALSAIPTETGRALSFVKDILARDPSHPHILVWAASEGLPIDFSNHAAALDAEAAKTDEIQTAVAYAMAAIVAGQGATLGTWLDRWRDRFEAADASPMWTYWRAQAYVAAGDPNGARSMLPGLHPDQSNAVEALLLGMEARQTGDDTKLVKFLEAAACETANVQFLFDATSAHARAGRWTSAMSHVDELLQRLPTPPVRRLAIFARFHTGDLAGCRDLLDQALAPPLPVDEAGRADALTFRRLRGQILSQTGNVLGALADLQAVVSASEHHASANTRLTQDLLSLARVHFAAGQTHEMAALARQLRCREDLTAAEALMLAEVLVHDDALLARELWERAATKGISDTDVTRAITLGYQLGLEAQMGGLHARLAALAAAGAPGVERIDLNELLGRTKDWIEKREHILELYRRGEAATHVVAKFLNEPLVHFYHSLPAAHEARPSLRHRFQLQFRDGSRRLPTVAGPTTSPAQPPVAASGRLAMDLSALLLAAHLEILDVVEAQYAPIRLPSLAIVALQEQRDKLKPHQPSRLEIIHRLLAAERLGQLSVWDGELPVLAQSEREAAAQWASWLALLERAWQEGAFVLDLPLTGDTPKDRPGALAGPERLERLVTLTSLRRFLQREGLLDGNASVPNAGVLDDVEGLGSSEPRTETHSSGARLSRGAVLYMTDAGAEMLAEANLVGPASAVLALRVDPNEQHARRAGVEALPELHQRVAWVEALIRRVSEGLLHGRYVLLPPGSPTTANDDQSTRTSDRSRSTPPDPHGELPPTGHAVETVEHVATVATPNVGLPDGAASPPQRANSDVDHDADEKDDGRWLSPTLRCLRDLLSQHPGVDTVWIDDRFINRHHVVGTARVTDVVDVLVALEAAGRIPIARRWSLYLRLRAANIKALPLSAEELEHHVRAAPIVEGVVVETPALRVLRQSAATLLEDVRELRIPSPEQLAGGEVGELDLARSYSEAVRGAVLAVWRSVGPQPDAAAIARAQAQSRWIFNNLHVDLGLLRAHMMPQFGKPDPKISALDTANLLFGALQLLAKQIKDGDDADQSKPNVEGPASAYSRWVYDAVVAERMTHDPAFATALVEALRRLLCDSGIAGGQHRVVRRLLLGRMFDAWPEVLQRRLRSDEALMRHLGREFFSSLSIGRWHVPTERFARGAAEILSGEAHAPGVTLPALGTAPPVILVLGKAEPAGFNLAPQDGDQGIHLLDPAFGVLADDKATRRSACEAVRRDADAAVAEWRTVTDALVAMNDPAKRLITLAQHRKEALRSRYREMAERWKSEHQFRIDDLSAPSPASVLRHLRVKLRMTTEKEGPPETSHQVQRAVWEVAAATLVAEEGVEEAFDRLAGVPVPMPETIHQALDAMAPDARLAFAHRLIRMPTSPLGIAHNLRALAWLGTHDPRYHRLGHRLARRLTDTSCQEYIALFRLAASEAHASLRLVVDGGDPLDAGSAAAETTASPGDNTRPHVGTGDQASPENTAESAAQHTAARLLASWYHAHRVVGAFVVAGADPSAVVAGLTRRDAERIGELFDPGSMAAPDFADPHSFRPARFGAAALQYASADTTLMDGADDLLAALRPAFLQPGLEEAFPHFELLGDLSGHPDVLGTLLQPTRVADGTITMGTLVVVAPENTPDALRAAAIGELEKDPTVETPWIMMEVVAGGVALAGRDGARFWEALASRDIVALLVALGRSARIAATRLARQALQVPGTQASERLREALIQVGTRSESKGPFTRTEARVARTGAVAEELTELQEGVVEALYILAQAEATPAAAMRTFALGLTAVGRTDPTYLRAVRGVLERLVTQRPLAEAEACLPLLFAVRGS